MHHFPPGANVHNGRVSVTLYSRHVAQETAEPADGSEGSVAIEASGASYDDAREALVALVPSGRQLVAIATWPI